MKFLTCMDLNVFSEPGGAFAGIVAISTPWAFRQRSFQTHTNIPEFSSKEISTDGWLSPFWSPSVPAPKEPLAFLSPLTDPEIMLTWWVCWVRNSWKIVHEVQRPLVSFHSSLFLRYLYGVYSSLYLFTPNQFPLFLPLQHWWNVE